MRTAKMFTPLSKLSNRLLVLYCIGLVNPSNGQERSESGALIVG